MKNLLLAALLFSLSTAATAQGAPQTQPPNASQIVSPDEGRVTDNLYENNFFRFSLKFPTGWYVHGQETNKRVMELGRSSLKEKGAISDASADVAEKHTFILLNVFEKPLGTPNVKMNRALISMAEDVSFAPGIKNGEDYLLNLEPVLEKAGWTKVTLEKIQVGGVESHRLIMKTPSNTFESFTATLRQGYALGFIALADSSERLADAHAAIETCKFENLSPKQPPAHPAAN